jgi:hypothetical protein
MNRHPALFGLRRATRNLPLALILWIFHLALAFAVVVPFASRLGALLDRSPEAVGLLDRPSVDLVVEVLRAESGLFAALRPLIGAVALLALIGNALLAGGVLESLLSNDARPLAHRFGRGAGRFAGRMLRIGALATPVALLLPGLAAIPWMAVSRRLASGDHEIASSWLRLAGFAAGGLVLLMVLMALDLARVRLVRDDRHDTARLFARSIARVLRHPIRVLGTWTVIGLCFLAVLTVYWLLAGSIPATSTVGIALIVLLQQLVMVGRAGLRVALWSAEIEIDGAWRPALPPASDSAGDQGMP